MANLLFRRYFSASPLRLPSNVPSYSKRIFANQLHGVIRVAQGFFFFHLFWNHFYSVSPATGASMLPTINIVGDYLVVSKLYSRGRGCKVGDVISYVHPTRGPGDHIAKRVVGMPGDFVVMDPLVAPGEARMIQVPEGHCWTAGDNLPYSSDSRHHGPVPLALVRGRVIARMWPQPKFLENALRPMED